MGQAKQRKAEIEKLKQQAKRQARELEQKFQEVSVSHNMFRIEIETTGPSTGYHSVAVPRADFRLDKNSSALKHIVEATKDTKTILPHLTDDSAYMLAGINYVIQAVANGITNYKDKGQVFMMMGEILRRSIEPIVSNASKVSVKMSTMPSPASYMGLPGDKFISGFGNGDFIRVYDQEGNLVIDWNHKTIVQNQDAEKVSKDYLEKFIERILD